MSFSYHAGLYPYPSRREVVYGRKGMVCTSQHLAAQAGLDVLKQGGNAVDAALATAICLTVLEPTSNGIGSDLFALIWTGGRLYGINGSGPSPALLTRDRVTAAGYDAMPLRGWLPVMVPGAPAAWAAIHDRFGRLPFERLFAAAIAYAEEGYAVMPTLAAMLAAEWDAFSDFRAQPAFAGLFSVFYPTGKPAQPGDLLKLPALGRTLRSLAASRCRSLYDGPIGAAVAAFSLQTGGLLRQNDLAAYQPQWVDPICTNYRGYDIWEMPPNGQGLVVLMALNIASRMTFAQRDTVDTLHRQIEAMKLAFTDGKTHIADPNCMKTNTADLLADAYAEKRYREIGAAALLPQPVDADNGGTVYLCTADEDGTMVSLIQSNFAGFGSGIVVPGYGISLNDRGNNFSLDTASDNCVGPSKRSYHTIIPGFVTKNGDAVGAFGVMGAFMQPQGQFQVLMNTIDFHLNPQAALDAPRWQWLGGKKIEVERGIPQALIDGLTARGHEVSVNADPLPYGRGQIIWRNEDGVLTGATEPRADGVVAAW